MEKELLLKQEYTTSQGTTQCKGDEAALRESEEKFRLLADFTYDWESWVDPKGNYIYVSPSCERITGHSADEFYRDPGLLIKLIHPDDRAAYEHHKNTHIKSDTGGSSIDFRIVMASGETRWVNHLCQPVFGSNGEWLGRRASNRDITERKQAEEALKRNEASRDRAQRITSLGNWEWDLKTNTLSGSREYYRILGEAPAGPVPFEHFTRMLHPDDGKWVKDMIADIQYENMPAGYEFRLLLPGGEELYIHLDVEAVPDENGQPVKIFGTMQDITESKKAEITLRESEEKYHSIIEQSSNGFILVDEEGVIVDFNPAGEQITGLRATDWIGKRLWDFNVQLMPASARTPEMREQMRAQINDAYRTGFAPWLHKQMDITLQRPDGEMRTVQIMTFPLRTSQGAHFGTFIRDVTEHKRDEEALKLAQFTLETSEDEVAWMDSEARVIYVNDAACKALRYTRDELLSLRVSDLDPNFPGEKWPEFWREAREKGHLLFESTHRSLDGHIYPVEITVDFIKSGNKEFISSFARDITERKRVEDTLKRNQLILAKSQEIAHVGNWAWNVQTDDLMGSEENGRIMGYSEGGVRPTMLLYLSLVHPEDREIATRHVESVLKEGKTGSIDYRIIRRDGSTLYVNTVADKIVRDNKGNIKWVYGINQDITERKQTEEALRSILQRLNTILSSMSGCILLVTEEDRVEFANEMFCKYFDLRERPVELVGLAAHEIIEKIRGTYLNPDEAVVRIGEIVEQMEPVIGEEIAMRSGRTHLRDFIPLSIDGKRCARLWYHFDISDRKRAEDALLAAKMQADLYLDLMGHDINNMHQIALGYLELARDMPPDAVQGDYLDKPIEVLQSSARLIWNVRKLQRLREGVFQAQKVDVVSVVSSVQREFGGVPGKTIMLNLNSHEHCYIMANELLHDVFANLVSNAIRHAGDTAAIIIDVDRVVDDGKPCCRVIVEDDDPGIPDDTKGKIFNRMHMGSARGMGLGLYLVKSLVDSYGGRVWAGDRVPGDYAKGAKFIVMMPTVEQ